MSKSTMSKTAMILAAGLTLAFPAAAETLKPLQGASLDFGDVTGIAYYVPGAEGDRVVVTLARPDGIKPVRFETLLSGEQRVSMSVPAELGSGANGIEIRRAGGRISVVPFVQTATAR